MAADTGDVLARLDAAAGDGDLLAAAWDSFDYVLIVAGAAADPGSAPFPALQLAAVAAAAGRDAVGHAPSMPATAALPGPDPPDPARLAGMMMAAELAELAAALHGRLSQAAALAAQAADRAALGQAAAEALAICDLLGD